MPPASWPLSPRQSCREASVGLFGRFTHCTGKRRPLKFQSLAICTVSKCPSRVGPQYHGVCFDVLTTLSPCSALIGTNLTSLKTSSFGRKASTSLRICRNRYSFQSRSEEPRGGK